MFLDETQDEQADREEREREEEFGEQFCETCGVRLLYHEEWDLNTCRDCWTDEDKQNAKDFFEACEKDD